VVDTAAASIATPASGTAPAVVGPAAGSVALVRDIDPSGASNPTGLAAFRGHVAFSARDDSHGREPWITTSTSAKRLRDIVAGTGSSTPRDFTAVGSTLYFSANDGVHGRELWRTDGTTAGTHMVKDVRPGSRGSSIGSLIRFDGKLFFAANDGVHGSELWKSDGTAGGTRVVKDIQPGHDSAVFGSSGFPSSWVVMGGRLYFDAHRDFGELWRTDGTAGGTSRVKGRIVIDGSIAATSARLYFMGSPDDGGCALAGPFFYTSDGTATGTRELHAAPDPEGSVVTLDGKAYFGANGEAPFRRLFRSSGTNATTARVLPKVALDDFEDIVRSHGRIFVSQDGALAISDGTGAGTHLLGDPSLGWRASVDVVAVGGTWFFPAGDGSERELWQSNGTKVGTIMVDDINPGGTDGVTSLVASGGSVWFTANDGTHGRELYRFHP
jgi:ELWxxDGT repeat protein